MLVNTTKQLDTFADENSLGYRIPDDSFAPRYINDDIIIFRELTPQEITPDLLLLLYNETEFHIGRSLSDLSINKVNHPYTGFHIGLIEQIVPS
jgi:hypothetical protein